MTVLALMNHHIAALEWSETVTCIVARKISVAEYVRNILPLL